MTFTSMLDRSARWADGDKPLTMKGVFSESSGAAEEVADGVVLVEAFSNSVAFDTDEGLVVFDVSHALSAPRVVEQLRAWRTHRVHTAVYTHGHADHVNG
ncbi:MAG: MBL fold metallo-hydrolase, partial [Ilumatobacteraceae bacterium]